MNHSDEIRSMTEFRRRYGCQHIWRYEIDVWECVHCHLKADYVPTNARRVVEGIQFEPPALVTEIFRGAE